MDQGITLPFSTQGIEDATFGMPTFKDGWKGLIITGSSQKALTSGQGGRLLLHVKCTQDPDGGGGDVGKNHIISLNLWHPEGDTKQRAEQELASICRVIGVMQFNNTNELYNKLFFAKAVTQTPAPTQQYPNPQPQTNWRGYKDQFGNDPQNAGQNAGGAPAGFGGGGPQGGPPPNFNQQQPQQQQPQQQQQQGWNPNQQQSGNPQGGGGGWNPNQNPQQQQQQADPNAGGGGAGGWGPQGGGASSPNANPNQFGNGGNAQSPSDQGGGWANPNQQQQQQQPAQNNWGGQNQQQQQPQQQQGGNTVPWGQNG